MKLNQLFQNSQQMKVQDQMASRKYVWFAVLWGFHGVHSALLWTVAHQTSAREIFLGRILEWVAMPFSQGSCQPRDPIYFYIDWQADSLPLTLPR